MNKYMHDYTNEWYMKSKV